MIKIDATKNILKVRTLEPLTSNSVNVNQVQFSFNSAWDGLSKTAVFRAGSTPVSVLLSGDSCAIPWEVLQKAGARVEAGVYGTQGEEIVLPTIWADIGEVQEGTKPGESGKEPTPDIYAQLLQAFPAGGTTGQVLAKASNDDRDVKWVNQTGGGGGTGGADGKDGGYYTPSVTQPDENTMQVAYTASDPAMPSVPSVNVALPVGPPGTPGIDGKDGLNGLPGADGYSPTANVTQTETGAVITITDKTGTSTATIKNGEDGAPGQDGGYYTPSVTQPNANTMRVSFAPSDSGMPAVQTVDVELPPGPAGTDGQDGNDGMDGITPTIGDNGNWYLGDTDTGKPSQGEPGATPNIQIGTVETLPAESPATASMTGTVENPLLNLGIPKGADGAGGGGNISLPLLYDLTTTEEVRWIDTGDNAFTANNFLIVELLSVATATNAADASGSASMYPTTASILISPWTNLVIANKVAALLPMTNDRVFRAFCFRGADGHWTSITSIRTSVNEASVTPGIITPCKEGLSDQPMRGIIIGDASAASGTRVLGIGSRLRVWGG